jgi:hypothetical protein
MSKETIHSVTFPSAVVWCVGSRTHAHTQQVNEGTKVYTYGKDWQGMAQDRPGNVPPLHPGRKETVTKATHAWPTGN